MYLTQPARLPSQDRAKAVVSPSPPVSYFFPYKLSLPRSQPTFTSSILTLCFIHVLAVGWSYASFYDKIYMLPLPPRTRPPTPMAPPPPPLDFISPAFLSLSPLFPSNKRINTVWLNYWNIRLRISWDDGLGRVLIVRIKSMPLLFKPRISNGSLMPWINVIRIMCGSCKIRPE